MTRWCFDTEFDEDGKTIELISIGLVSDKGDEYYAVSREFDPLHCSEWVQAHVLTKLPPAGDPLWKTRAQIAADIIALVSSRMVDKLRPEFWAWYADYDWVVLCQLFGRMVDLPTGWPMYCRDMKQRVDDLEIRAGDLPEQDPASEHCAIDDARWVRDTMAWLDRFYPG